MRSARRLIVALATCTIAACVSLPDDNYSIDGRIVAVADGDTLTLLDADKLQHKVRLDGIDAPDVIYLRLLY